MAKKKILTKAELECLLEVETTVEQAEMIQQRNEAALKAIDDFEKRGLCEEIIA